MLITWARKNKSYKNNKALSIDKISALHPDSYEVELLSIKILGKTNGVNHTIR